MATQSLTEENSDLSENEDVQEIEDPILVAVNAIRKFNISPPGISTFEDRLVQIPSPWGKKAVQIAPPISTELPLLKDKFSSLIKHFTAFQREILP